MPDQNLQSALLDMTDELFVVSTLLEMLQKGAVFGTAQLTLETCAAAASKCQEHITQLISSGDADGALQLRGVPCPDDPTVLHPRARDRHRV